MALGYHFQIAKPNYARVTSIFVFSSIGHHIGWKHIAFVSICYNSSQVRSAKKSVLFICGNILERAIDQEYGLRVEFFLAKRILSENAIDLRAPYVYIVHTNINPSFKMPINNF